ncbi:MAG: metal ABC transporter permease [Elusimicrobia bacterium]|nr:metal ABC transporter permease [Elusimicrobiota bacterium]MDE2425978.1 metal ABC transporter permease [Elusimicrobiota bacterium]
MLALFHYGFVLRGFEAGIIVALVAPLIGTFLVLRRYSLIADTLAHVSLAGIALGLLLGFNPILAALAVTVLASLGIESLRLTRRVYGESALALFLSGSLALATILLSLGRGFNTSLFNYLFGSIVTVTRGDVLTISVLAVIVAAAVAFLYKELVYITFDEESARVSGLPTRAINVILILLSALTITLSIPIIGVLLIAALIVVPVVAALQLRRSFAATIAYAEAISLFSVVCGMLASFYLNLSTGGTIVLIMLAVFLLLLLATSRRRGSTQA